MDHKPRQPKGIPAGGQFAVSNRAEAAVGLTEIAEPQTENCSVGDLAVGDRVWIGGAVREVSDVDVAIEPGSRILAFDGHHDPDSYTTLKEASIVGRVVPDRKSYRQMIAELADQSPLDGSAEFGTWVAQENELRRLAPEDGAIGLPDGRRVIVEPRGDAEQSAPGGIVEQGAYLVSGPGEEPRVHSFKDLSERGDVAAFVAHESIVGARGPRSFFHGVEPVYSYTRSQALADGVLRDRLTDGTDLSGLGREAGLPMPVAFTSEAYADAIAWTESNAALQDETGRAWDVLNMASRQVRAHAMKSNGALRVGERIPFTFVRVPNTPRARQPRQTEMHAVFGVDDSGEPCLTFMNPHED